MNVLDFILLSLILAGAILGLRRGFILSAGKIVAMLIGIVVAGKYFLLAGQMFGATNMANFFAFLVIYFIVSKLIGIFFWLLGKILQIVMLLPFLHTINKFMGFVLGLVESIMILSVLTFFYSRFPFNPWVLGQARDSILCSIFLKISKIVMPLLPDVLATLKSLI